MENESYSALQSGYEMSFGRSTYWITRFMILRLLGIVYAIAFLAAINQIIPLIGADGLTPLTIYLKMLSHSLGSAGAGFRQLPSLFWLWHSDTALITAAWIGFILSLIVAAGFANAPLLAILWFLYMSFVNAGQEWYGFGWEIQLLETGFLAIFLCPLLDMRPFPKCEPPFLIIVLFRWLAFRLMLGAGLIKLRGDPVWRNATALYYHFETQPIPGPFSRWFNFLPHPVLKLGVYFNWLAELMAPWLVFGPRIARHAAGIVIVLFQVTLIFSGNLSFLNWLSIIPALACFDDSFWSKILPNRFVTRAKKAAERAIPSEPMVVTSYIITTLVALLSIQPVINIFSSQQIMNTNYDPLDLVNTYGAFGTVGKGRFNIIFEGTMDNDSSDNAQWEPYIYKGLPVLLNKWPPQIAPYHLRLDWEMWFASMSSADEYPWTYNLVWKLLHNDANAVSLFKNNPFRGKPPRYVRAVLYQYEYAKPGNPQGLWWKRKKIMLWMPPLSVNNTQLITYLKWQGWIK